MRVNEDPSGPVTNSTAPSHAEQDEDWPHSQRITGLAEALAEKDRRIATLEADNAKLSEALCRLVALYESEQDAFAPVTRPAWLVEALAGQPVGGKS